MLSSVRIRSLVLSVLYGFKQCHIVATDVAQGPSNALNEGNSDDSVKKVIDSNNNAFR